MVIEPAERWTPQHASELYDVASWGKGYFSVDGNGHRTLTAEPDASRAAFEVGYESASQFNREYRRHFGRPPMQDVQDIRIGKRNSVA